MNSRIGVALFILVAAALGWLLKEQLDVNREQMNEIRALRARLGDNASQRANEIQRPAAEVFRLRSACADLGQRILEDNAIGSALSKSQISNYNPRTNRCYVELIVQTADTTKN